MERRSIALAGVLSALLLAGCGDKSLVEVSGKVSIDGQPVNDGAISLYPVDGATRTSGGKIQDGRYSFQAPLGEMKVSISVPKVVGSKKVYDTPDSPVMPITEEALPKKYNDQTELRLTIQPGANTKDWDLKTR